MKLNYSTVNLTDANNPTAPAVPCYVVYYRSHVLALPVNLELAYGDLTPVCLNEIVKEEVTKNTVLTLPGWRIKYLLHQGKHEMGVGGDLLFLRKSDNE